MKFGVILALSLVGVATPGTAQQAVPAKVGPTAMLVRALCIPWLSGVDGKALAASAEKNGFKAHWRGESLDHLNTPPALDSRGWHSVRFGAAHDYCEIDIAWVGPSRLVPVAAELDAFGAQAPAPWRFVTAAPVKNSWGLMPERAWAAPAATMTVHERTNDYADRVPGQPDPLAMTVHVQKR